MRITHIVFTKICVVCFQAVVQDNDVDTLASKTHVIDGQHVQIQSGQTGSSAGILLLFRS